MGARSNSACLGVSRCCQGNYDCPHAQVDLFKRYQLLEATDKEDMSHTWECTLLGLGTVFSLTQQEK